MKNSLKIFWVEDKMVNFQYQIDQCHIDLEFHRQKLRMLDSEIGTELFSKKPEEYKRDIEWYTQKIFREFFISFPLNCTDLIAIHYFFLIPSWFL